MVLILLLYQPGNAPPHAPPGDQISSIVPLIQLRFELIVVGPEYLFDSQGSSKKKSMDEINRILTILELWHFGHPRIVQKNPS
jgi:hypothetical protein